jgi:DNA-binding LacI/PurR family transcriptional regulator
MITRDDVAKYAGVSKSTVSRVLNNKGYVSADNRVKIEKAINDLGYTPNLIARSLKTRETRQLLFYAPDLANPFYMEVYQGMEDYAEENGYTIVVSRHYDHNIIKQRQFDGVILSYVSPEIQEQISRMDMPLVITDYSSEPLTVPYVRINVEEGASMAMNHLIAQGHRKIAYLTYNENEKDLRYQGYINSLKVIGESPNPKYIVSCSGNVSSFHQGHNSAIKMLDEGVNATAVYAFNDALAIGAISAFYEKGMKLPGDISIIGFDDILQSRFTCPPLTTIKIPKYEQGWESAKALIKLIKGESIQPITLNTELVIRNSVSRNET